MSGIVDTDVIVVGGGISGLACAWGLQQRGIRVVLLEAAAQPGGSIGTAREHGCLLESGPNSALDTTPLIGRLLDELGIAGERIGANTAARNRYILRDGRLTALPLSPVRVHHHFTVLDARQVAVVMRAFHRAQRAGCRRNRLPGSCAGEWAANFLIMRSTRSWRGLRGRSRRVERQRRVPATARTRANAREPDSRLSAGRARARAQSGKIQTDRHRCLHSARACRR